MSGTLYIVATPIGNMDDISSRAIKTLKAADLIACEDTRHTGKLLKRLGISKKLVSYHDHNESKRADELALILKEGRSIAVVSDAGTPGISDPCRKIVQKALANDIKVSSIPGAVAFVNAVVVSGLPTDAIFFGGFLPSKRGKRLKRLGEAAEIPATLCFYEAPHRIAKSLEDCLQILGDREVVIVRELTKLYEEIICGLLSELSKRLSGQKVKGEIVLVIDRKRGSSVNKRNLQSIFNKVAKIEKEGSNRKYVLKKIAKEMGVSKSEVCRILQREKKD